MIEESLVQYGVLGLWTASLLLERYYFSRNLGKQIEKNNALLIKVHDKIISR